MIRLMTRLGWMLIGRRLPPTIEMVETDFLCRRTPTLGPSDARFSLAASTAGDDLEIRERRPFGVRQTPEHQVDRSTPANATAIGFPGLLPAFSRHLPNDAVARKQLGFPRTTVTAREDGEPEW